MAKCFVCGESYADQLRRCPYCGDDPERDGPRFSPAPAPQLASGAAPKTARRRPKFLILGLLVGGFAALGLAIALPLGVRDEDEATATPLPGSQDPVEAKARPIEPKAVQQGFAVLEVRPFDGGLLVTGTCTPDATARILVNGVPAVVEPNGRRWHARARLDAAIEVVAFGMKGERSIARPPVTARTSIDKAGTWRLRSHADGSTVHVGRMDVTFGPASSVGRNREVAAELPGVANVIGIEDDAFLLYRAPPGLVFLRETPEGTYSFLRRQDGQEMILVPEGLSYRGIGDEAPHGPRSLVRTHAYLIDRTEVTARQYAVFLRYMARVSNAMLRHPDDPGVPLRPRGWQSDEPPIGAADHPVRGVSWYAAAAYALWVDGALPTEAQWERAAAGPSGSTYPWGQTFDAEVCRASGHGTVPADSMPQGVSPYGLLHMSGNVREWCEDRFDPRWYARVAPDDPGTPSHGRHRVVRGGSYMSAENTHRAQFREHLPPETNVEDIGFRVVWRWSDLASR